MVDSTQIPQSLTNLGDVIRAIERESGQPSQIVVKVGDDRYVVGDLRKRTGEYRLEMQGEYNADGLAGSYDSFDALSKAVRRTQERPGGGSESFIRIGEEVYHVGVELIGSPDHGYSVAVPGVRLGGIYGQAYNLVGRIIFPLLQDGEPVSVDKIER